MKTFTCTANIDVMNSRSNISRKVAQVSFDTEEENPDPNSDDLKNYIAQVYRTSQPPRKKIAILGVTIEDLKEKS